MDNYYEILDISQLATMEEIKTAYYNHINRFKGLPFLTDKMKEEIKKYKKALYILSDYHKRKTYDKQFEKNDKDISQFQFPSTIQKFTQQDFDPRQFHFNPPEYIDDGQINERLFGDTFKK